MHGDFLPKEGWKRGSKSNFLQWTWLKNVPSASMVSPVDSTRSWYDGGEWLCAPALLLPKAHTPQSIIRKKKKKWHITPEGPTKHLYRNPQNCRDYQKWGKSENFQGQGEPKETGQLKDMVFWTGFWDRERALAKNQCHLKKVRTLVSKNASLSVHSLWRMYYTNIRH